MIQKKVKEQLNHKIEELKLICEENKVPFLITYAEEKGNKTDYVSEVVTPLQCNIILDNDLITPGILLFSNGFRFIPNEELEGKS